MQGLSDMVFPVVAAMIALLLVLFTGMIATALIYDAENKVALRDAETDRRLPRPYRPAA